MAMPGPPELGRGVVVLPGMVPPEPWTESPRLVVGPEALDSPDAALEALHRAWFDRQPLVVELAVDPKALRDPQVWHRPVFALSPRFEFPRERLQFLLWANNYDARSEEPIWWHGRKAARSFGSDGVSETGPADIVLGDGTPLYVDGGPFGPPPLTCGTGVVHRWNTEAGSLSVVGHNPPEADLAADQLAAVAHRAGRRKGHRAGGLGKDSGAHRASPPPDRGPWRGTNHRDRSRLQYQGGGGDARPVRQPRHTPGATHPDAQQHRALHLQRVRGPRTAERLRGAPGAGSHRGGVRGPPAGERRHRPSLHRRAVGGSARPDVAGDRRGRDP